MNNSTISVLARMSWAPALVLLLHVIATLTGWYDDFWWFDIPLHFFGGMAITWASYELLEFFSFHNQFDSESKPLKILILIAFTALAAVFWEFMEFAFDSMLTTNFQPGLPDSIKDMCLGLLGGAIVAIYASTKRKK
jgi:hypothetical protein